MLDNTTGRKRPWNNDSDERKYYTGTRRHVMGEWGRGLFAPSRGQRTSEFRSFGIRQERKGSGVFYFGEKRTVDGGGSVREKFGLDFE